MNKRLRKKKRVSEFAEFGFDITVYLNGDLAAQDAFVDALCAFVEARGLVLGGGGPLGEFRAFVTHDGRGSTTEDDRFAMDKWLHGQIEMVREHVIGKLVDANAPRAH